MIQLGNIGNAYEALGQIQKSIAYYQESLQIVEQIGDKKHEAIVLGGTLGGVAVVELFEPLELLKPLVHRLAVLIEELLESLI